MTTVKRSASNGWTAERRARQAKLIRKWNPWEKSTGPKTEEGKVTASRNAYKGGTQPMLRAMSRALWEQRRALDELTGGTCGAAMPHTYTKQPPGAPPTTKSERIRRYRQRQNAKRRKAP